MLILLSPAKTLDYETPPATKRSTTPRLLDQAERLVDVARSLGPSDLAELMSISDELADLNAERFQDWDVSVDRDDRADPSRSRPAILAFKGDVYQNMKAETFDTRDFTWAQKRIRILSGLYGVLRPLDRIQPYRLEMGSKLRTERGDTLYEFWGSRITELLDADLEGASPAAVVNLASNEYFSAVDAGALSGRVISPRFEDWSDGQYKVRGFFAKRARGSMAGWLVRQRVDTIKGLRRFDVDGYRYDADASTFTTPVFRRRT